MGKALVFGHKNPDTDAICSAIAYSQLKNQLGKETEAVRLGSVSKETQYALGYFKTQAPREVTSVSDEVSEVILVDHNEPQQSVDDIREVNIREVIDHHRIANFETNDPIYYRAEPVGCTATILNSLYKEQGVAIHKNTAGLMLAAIISDTLLLKSPTCTEEDRGAAYELAAIAEVDIEQFGLAMLKAGTDMSDQSAQEIILQDAKDFRMGNYDVTIAQVNTVDTPELFDRQNEIEHAISNLITEKGLDLFVFMATDILTSDSMILALGEQAPAVEPAFQVSLSNNRAIVKGVVSRKKQIVPSLTDSLS
ncbi:manganese-dependent inorganic pyrophosphatase [Thalassobacillus sp. CUG 92003]|uniref:manganese-dependent inorganic pyrophosphatase n=1 Tax=Thalassobacillus sp. CUG 92003 TaxID=2736641 RepID=UPI0015E63851|nr:manganese-dependent inorganic pyrophosphatase [Thalassobacillus sp. CUG 92003]